MITQKELINKLAEDLGKYSPVIVVGNAGTGKTYMLKTLVNLLSDKKVQILTGEKITNSLIESIKTGNRLEWRNKLLEQSVLLIDDLDSLKGRSNTQENLLSVLNEYDKPVIATFEKPLNKEEFSNAFVSYFSEGTHVYLDMLEPEEKKNFYKSAFQKICLILLRMLPNGYINRIFPIMRLYKAL